MYEFTVLVVKLFWFITEGVLLSCIPTLFPNRFILGMKASCNGRSFLSNKPLDLQKVTYLVPLPIYKSNISNVE